MMVRWFFQFHTNLIDFPAVRVEWCKAWARSRRWSEEVCLLVEEMRRVLASHEHKAAWWRDRRQGLGSVWPSMDHAEGGHAYASEHAALHESLLSHCKRLWERKSNPQETSNAPPVENDVADSDDSEDVIEDVEMELL